MPNLLTGTVLFDHTGPGGHGITSPDMLMVKYDPGLPGDRKFSIAARSVNSLKSEVVLLTEGQMLDLAISLGAWTAHILHAKYPTKEGELCGND